MENAWAKCKKLYDVRRTPLQYSNNDKVLVKRKFTSSFKDRFTTFIAYQYEGPFVIHKFLTVEYFYCIQRVDDEKRRVYIDQTKKYIKKKCWLKCFFIASKFFIALHFILCMLYKIDSVPIYLIPDSWCMYIYRCK